MIDSFILFLDPLTILPPVTMISLPTLMKPIFFLLAHAHTMFAMHLLHFLLNLILTHTLMTHWVPVLISLLQLHKNHAHISLPFPLLLPTFVVYMATPLNPNFVERCKMNMLLSKAWVPRRPFVSNLTLNPSSSDGSTTINLTMTATSFDARLAFALAGHPPYPLSHH